MPKALRKNTSSFQRHTYLTQTTVPSQDVPFTDVAMPCEKQVSTSSYLASNEYSLSLPSSMTSVSSTSSSINNDVDIDIELMRLKEICHIYVDEAPTQLELNEKKRCSLAMIHKAVFELSKKRSNISNTNISNNLKRDYPTYTSTPDILRTILRNFGLELSQLQRSSVQTMQDTYGNSYIASMEPVPIPSLSLRELHEEIYTKPGALSYFLHMKKNVITRLRRFHLSIDDFLVVSPEVLQAQLTEDKAWYEEKKLTKEKAQRFLALVQKIVEEKEATQVTSTTMLAGAPELLIEETCISSVTSSSFGLFSPPSVTTSSFDSFSPPSTTSSSFGLFSPPSVSNDHALNSSNSSLRSDYISEEKSALINEIDDLQQQFDQVIHWLNNPAELELDLFVNGSSDADLDQDTNKEALILLAQQCVEKQNLLLHQIRELDYQQKCIVIGSLR